MLKKIKKYLPTKRKIMQLYFALLFNANLKGFVSGNIFQGNTKSMCVPGINCYSCPGAVGACPLGSLQGSFANRSAFFYVGGILLLYGITLGRMICGWLCPFGLIQELLYKIPTPKLKKSPVTRLLSWFKYFLLAVFVFLIPMAYVMRDTPLPAFCKYICPAGTIEGGLGLLSNKVNESYFSMLGPIFTWKFLLMVSIVVGTIFIFRLFCRFLCSLGALYGLFNRISFLGVQVNAEKCTNCNLCVNHCKMDVKKVADFECISCGECISVCPTKAISFKGGKLLLHPNEGEAPEKTQKKRTVIRVISAVVLVAILIGSWVYFWPKTSATPVQPDTPSASGSQQGNQIGDTCYSYSLPLLDGSGKTGESIDPSATGKITVINFWGTWCTPCVKELPYFERIATEYKDTVTVVAVHSRLVTSPTPEDYIAGHYPESSMLFAIDEKPDASGANGEYYTMLGGRGTYPMTLILDENGVILEVLVKPVTYEMLKSAVDAALAGK